MRRCVFERLRDVNGENVGWCIIWVGICDIFASLVCCFGLFHAAFSMSPRATMGALSLSREPDAVCLAFRTSLTGTMTNTSLRGCLPRIKVS